MQALHELQHILDAIEAGLGQPLNVEDLADRVGYSRWHFQRLFAVLTGMTPAGYIRARRLSEAARALQTGQGRVLPVALAYGFESQAAFTRAFRQYFGLPPGAARKSCRALPLQQPLQIHTLSFGGSMLNPTFVQEPARTVAGLSARFTSAMAPTADNLQVIPALWDRVSPYLHALPRTDHAQSFGVIDAHSEQADSEGALNYLACAQIELGTAIPTELELRQLPGGLYARFTHTGPLAEIGRTMRQIYVDWLPQSGYALDQRPDLELYDSRFRPDLGQTVFDVLIPVQKQAP